MAILLLIWLASCLLPSSAAGQSQPTVPPVWPGPSYDPRQSPGQYVFLTPEKNAIVIYEPDRLDQGFGMRCWLVPLLNEAEPHLSVELSQTPEGLFEFRYTLANGPTAKTPIGRFALALEPDDPQYQMRHGYPDGPGWGSVPDITTRPRIAVQVALPGAPNGVYAGWFHDAFTNLIYPGQKMDGFVLRASYRPGFTTAYIGPGKGWDVDMNWPGAVWEQLSFLAPPEWREQHVLTIGPRYPPGADARRIADEFLTGIGQWISSGRLDPRSPFVTAARAALERWRIHPQGILQVPVEAFSLGEWELQAALRFTLGNPRD